MRSILVLSILLLGSLWLGSYDISYASGDSINPVFNEPYIAQVNLLGIHWGDFKPDHCMGQGKRQYSAILWDIPWGQSWETTCASMPADINGNHFESPSRCVNTGLNMWGEFDVPDESCPMSYWDPFKPDSCTGVGVRQYSAILRVPAGASWETECNRTGATILGQQFDRPTRCEKTDLLGIGLNMWGEFDVKDESCMPKWQPFKADQCVAVGVRQYSAQLLVPYGLAWETCSGISATIQGQKFDMPARCENEGIGGMWGEFDVNDDSCTAKWEPFKADQCVAVGVRQYSAQLLVPDGLSWEVSCEASGAAIRGQEFDKPNRCINTGLTGMWGEFDVKDDSCTAKWEPFKADRCVAIGVRQYSAQLLVPDGLSWEVSCEATGATIQGQRFDKPDRCVNTGLTGMWGEFDVEDESCTAKWEPVKADQCTSTSTRQYSAQLLVPDGLSWEVSCEATGATIRGQVFTKPDRCINTGLTGMWGEFDVTNRFCIIEYPLTHMSWQTIVAIVVVLLVVVGLVILFMRFLPLKKILQAMHKDEK